MNKQIFSILPYTQEQRCFIQALVTYLHLTLETTEWTHFGQPVSSGKMGKKTNLFYLICQQMWIKGVYRSGRQGQTGILAVSGHSLMGDGTQGHLNWLCRSSWQVCCGLHSWMLSYLSSASLWSAPSAVWLLWLDHWTHGKLACWKHLCLESSMWSSGPCQWL